MYILMTGYTNIREYICVPSYDLCTSLWTKKGIPKLTKTCTYRYRLKYRYGVRIKITVDVSYSYYTSTVIIRPWVNSPIFSKGTVKYDSWHLIHSF